jgi:RIO-like serine/threonine protein kinase
MSPKIQQFLELERKKEEAKQIYKQLNEATEALAEEIGIGGHFQDGEGTVYQIVQPAGTFIEYHRVGYERTKRGEEKRGSLSVKRAKELGYDIS